MFEAETVEQIKAVMAKGVAGTVFLTTEDCRADFEELKGRGVEFVEEPEERPYGIDAGFRDPSGNHLRLTQVTMAGRVCMIGPTPGRGTQCRAGGPHVAAVRLAVVVVGVPSGGAGARSSPAQTPILSLSG